MYPIDGANCMNVATNTVIAVTALPAARCTSEFGVVVAEQWVYT
ncbi:hypothetical protein ACWGH5_04545 [Streptomyces sp. NPDC054864]